MGKYFGFVKSKWFIGVGCLLLGVLIILGIRFFTYSPEKTHYHANFEVYINGQREEFQGPQYYADIEMCKLKNVQTPIQRVHMHSNINNVIHVEAPAVTWGHFFANLGWTLGPDFIADAQSNIYATKDNDQLHMILNGQDYTGLGGLNNTTINDQDKLLISYGNISQDELSKEYKSIPSTAKHYDETPDPKSCSSGQSAPSASDRFDHLF